MKGELKVKFVVFHPDDGEQVHDTLTECKKDIEYNKLDLEEVKIIQIRETREDVTDLFIQRFFKEGKKS